MRAAVSEQRVAAGECSITHDAAVRPVAGVNAHVLAKIAGAHEATVAVRAGERAPVGRHVDGRVTVQGAGRRRTMSADAAQVTAIAGGRRVCPHVTLKRADVNELATAHGAQQTMLNRRRPLRCLLPASTLHSCANHTNIKLSC